MEDIERYGDYDEIDEAPQGSKNPVTTIIKAIIISLCFIVVGLILFRVILFNYYPKGMKNVYFDEKLSEYYSLQDGEIFAKTQKLRAPYDDPDFASFFADNLIIIKDVGQLQLSVRYNSSLFDTIEEKYGVRLDPESDSLFEFELERVPFEEGREAETVGTLTHSESASLMMYTYNKLVFSDVEYLDPETPDWLRLKITLKGVQGAEPYYILVYENTEEYSAFEDYKLSKGERPDV
ncbi:MAG: hypothetical protein IJW02_06740 [Clostridia bacterium]|nr:hypothetical protein [Clostridia bacterium]